MKSDLIDGEDQREYIHGIILNRGRQVDLHHYLMKHPEELLKGVLVAGSIGSGKTHRSISVICSALDSGYGVLVFDPSNDYQRLLRRYEQGVVIDFSEYYLNPLEPPSGLSPEEWSSIFIQVFAQNFGLKDPSIAILQASLNNLITKSQDNYPTLIELLEEVVQYQPRSYTSETSSHASVQNRLESVLASEWGRCLDVREGFSPENFEEGLLVIKIRPVGIERIHELVIGLTVAKLSAYRFWRQNRGEPLGKNVLVVLEEAHRFLSEGRQGDRYGQTLYLERALVESRKIGVGFVIVDQMPNRISDYVLGSCSVWIVCKLMDPNSRRMVGEALRTDVIWSHIGLMELPIGAAIIRVDNQRELEDTSPMAYVNEKHLYNVTGLPATVALPTPQQSLIPSFDSKEVWDRMVKNERYMQYFGRILTQDYQRIKELLSESEKREIHEFILRATNTKTEEAESPTNPKQSTIPEALDKFQIDVCRQLVGILSSEIRVELLHKLLELGESNIHQLAIAMSKTPSWLSRILNTMLETEVIQRKAGTYSLTKEGMRLLQWSESVSREAENPNSESTLVGIGQENLRCIMNLVTEDRVARERSTIAGWSGGQAKIDEIIRIEYLLHYISEQKRMEPPAVQNLSVRIFQALKTSLDSGVLTLLLTNARPVLLEQITKQSGVGTRSTRRQLKLLEDNGIVKRIRSHGQKEVSIHESWRVIINHLVTRQSFRTFLPVNLFQKALRIAKDYTMRELLFTGKKSPMNEQTVNISDTCLRD